MVRDVLRPHTNLVQISLTVPEIMGCLPERTYGNHGPPMKTVWRPTFSHQILWRFHLPFRNYSDFNFAPVWLENACSRPK